MGARRQTLAHKQRIPTSQGDTDKYAFCAPYDGHFVDNKQSHCRPVVCSSSQSQNTTHVRREECAHDVSDLINLMYDHVNQVENALTKMMQSLTGVIAEFENLVNGMSCSNDMAILCQVSRNSSLAELILQSIQRIPRFPLISHI